MTIRILSQQRPGRRAFRSAIAIASALSIIIGYYSVSSAVSDDTPQDDLGYGAASATARDLISTPVDEETHLKLVTYASASGQCLDVLVIQKGSDHPSGLVGSCGKHISGSLGALETGRLLGALSSTSFEVVSGRVGVGNPGAILFLAGGVAACDACAVRLNLSDGRALSAPVTNGVFAVATPISARSVQSAESDADSTARRRAPEPRVVTAELRTSSGEIVAVRSP